MFSGRKTLTIRRSSSLFATCDLTTQATRICSQKHVGGFSDYISYNVNDLNHTVRWILSHEDQKVNGMALPATCGPEGYHREKEKGNVRQIEGKNSKSFSVKVGALDAPATTEMEKRIESLK